MYQHLLFDLDGTLTDPGLGITNSVMYALKKFGVEVSDRASLATVKRIIEDGIVQKADDKDGPINLG